MENRTVNRNNKHTTWIRWRKGRKEACYSDNMWNGD